MPIYGYNAFVNNANLQIPYSLHCFLASITIRTISWLLDVIVTSIEMGNRLRNIDLHFGMRVAGFDGLHSMN